MRSVDYVGLRTPTGCVVYFQLDGIYLPLPPRNDLRNHSPDGFEWGYAGSGPAQLALALLAERLGSVNALNHYQNFKRDVLVHLHCPRWEMMASVIDDWFADQPIILGQPLHGTDIGEGG